MNAPKWSSTDKESKFSTGFEMLWNWLKNLETSEYTTNIAELQYALQIFTNISNWLKAKQQFSLSDVFSDNLTLDEFREYRDWWFNDWFQWSNMERGLFLNSIYTHKLSRRDAAEYAQLKKLERDWHLTEEQEQLLVDYNFFIESDPKSRDLKAITDNFAQDLWMSTQELWSHFKTSILLGKISERVKNTWKK